MVAFRFVQTLHALARLGITIARLVQIHIVAAVALLADSPWSFRISKVVVRADIALGTCVALIAQTNHIVRLGIQQTLVGIRMTGSYRIGTAAWAAPNL